MTGSDDYVCEHCGEVFESEAGVDMHRERNHGEAGASSSDSEGVTLQLSTSHAIAASFLIGIFVGGFFMGALGGGTTGMFAAPTVDTGGNGGSPSDTGNTGNNGGTTKIDMSKIEMKGEPVLGELCEDWEGKGRLEGFPAHTVASVGEACSSGDGMRLS
ncbi:MAG: hypothetical protein SVU32_07135 [Candidatus Nanohaloarchaea archaeon]|nr:hypothetical protein [Candidatus Nanohaloarchaea archaeon]